MKFKTSDNLIDLLVGQNLYANPDVAMRELLQNAEDACHLQSLGEQPFNAEIVVRASVAENWVVDFTRFSRQISTSSSKLLECQRTQLV